MKLWLDDEREAPEGWVRVFNVPQLMHMFRNPANEVQEISLDHDLGENEMTGYDFLRWLESQVFLGNIKSFPPIKIHSANPVGRKNMELALASIKRMKENGS
jgi:hypothetical protein